MSKASERQAAFANEVSAILLRAEEVAQAASAAFAATAKRSPEGHILDECGGGYVTVFKPTYRLREALKSLERSDGSYKGGWRIRGCWTTINAQSVTLEERGAQAACEFLRNALAGEGEFFSGSYLS